MSEFLDRIREALSMEDETERDMRIIQIDSDIDSALGTESNNDELNEKVEKMQCELDRTKEELTETKRKYADLYFGKTQEGTQQAPKEGGDTAKTHPKTMAELFG